MSEDAIKEAFRRCVESARNQISKKRGRDNMEGVITVVRILKKAVLRESKALGFDWSEEKWLHE